MRTRILILTAVLLSVVSLIGYFGARLFENSSAATRNNRIRFQIAAIEEKGGGAERKVLSETFVEGQPGTDFNINLQTERFRMQARFLSDLIAPEKLKIKAKLNTRRLYGQSERGLPLYEEDAQAQTIEVGFDESIVLLPFGRGETEILKIEITPMLLTAPAEAERHPLKIEFGKQLTNGEISVQAVKIPHRFAVEAVLLADGREVARGTCNCLLEEEQKIILQPNNRADAEVADQPLTVNFTIDGYARSRTADTVAFKFDAFRMTKPDGGEAGNAVTKGAGAAMLGGDLNYEIEQAYQQSDKKYELRFNIRLGEGERAD